MNLIDPDCYQVHILRVKKHLRRGKARIDVSSLPLNDGSNTAVREHRLAHDRIISPLKIQLSYCDLFSDLLAAFSHLSE